MGFGYTFLGVILLSPVFSAETERPESYLTENTLPC